MLYLEALSFDDDRGRSEKCFFFIYESMDSFDEEAFSIPFVFDDDDKGNRFEGRQQSQQSFSKTINSSLRKCSIK